MSILGGKDGKPINEHPGWYKSFGMRLNREGLDERITKEWTDEYGDVWAYAICESGTDKIIAIIPEKHLGRFMSANADIKIKICD